MPTEPERAFFLAAAVSLAHVVWLAVQSVELLREFPEAALKQFIHVLYPTSQSNNIIDTNKRITDEMKKIMSLA